LRVKSKREKQIDSLPGDRGPLRSPEESKKEEVGIKKFAESKTGGRSLPEVMSDV
jgi:hypothetical protein